MTPPPHPNRQLGPAGALGTNGDAGNQLHRSIGLTALTLYGIGVTLGAGIYVLIGETAALAGGWAPLSFVLAGLVAGLSALSYGELSTRLPVSAGEAAYVRVGLQSKALSQLVGYGVVATGLLSSATILQGFAGYWAGVSDAPRAAVIGAAAAGLTGLAIWGVRSSVYAAGAIAVLELLGLAFILVVAAPAAVTAPAPFERGSLFGLAAAASVAFFAFIGFEDIVNMAEETRDPVRVLPRAILITLVVSTAVYAAVVWAAVVAVEPSRLAQSSDPMVEVLRATGAPGENAMSGLAMLAIINGALIQMIMASRVLYGMARQGAAPPLLGRVHPKRRTPHIATAIVGLAMLALALSLALGELARATSFVTLGVFALVNVSLIAIRRREPAPEAGVFRAPQWSPWAGAVSAVALMGFALVG